MENKAFGLNRGIFSGKVVSAPVYNHQVTHPETNEVVKEYYLLEMEVEFENKKKTIKDESALPFLLTKDQLDEVGSIEVGDLLFIKGKFRAYDRRGDDGKRHTLTRVLTTKIEKVDEVTRTQNKIELHGFLKGKLYKVEFDENGRIKRDEQGNAVPVLDEDENRIPWTRRNKEGLTVNDITLQVPKEIVDENGEVKRLYQDFIPAIGYGGVAWQIAKEIDVNSKVKARGYIRSREKNGHPGEYVYEAVIRGITSAEEDDEQEEDTDQDQSSNE